MSQNNSQDQVQSKTLINNFLTYLEKTQDSEWLMEKCADTPELNKCCIVGHFFKFTDITNNQKNANKLWDNFSWDFANEFMFYPVNDGKDKNYQQPTPKQRCIAYLEDLRDGKAETTAEGMEREHKLWLQGVKDE